MKRDGQDAHSPALATDACHDCRQQRVDPAARTEVQHFLTLPKFRHCNGLPQVSSISRTVSRDGRHPRVRVPKVILKARGTC